MISPLTDAAVAALETESCRSFTTSAIPATMRQVFIVGPSRTEVREVDVPEPAAGQVLVKIHACGVCASELFNWQTHDGKTPKTIGHEPAGEIVAVGDGVTQWQIGDRVTGLFEYGTFAEYGLARADMLVRLPDDLPYHEALGEPLACALSGISRTEIQLGDRVAVVGLGFMGLLSLIFARLKGPSQLIGIDTRPEARELAKRLGADEVYHPQDLPASYRCGWDAKTEGIDVAIEAAGNQASLDLAGEIPRAHGILSIVGFHIGDLRHLNMALWNYKAMTILNAHERRMDYQINRLTAAIALLDGGRFSMEPLVTHHYELENLDQAIHDLIRKPAGFVKAVVEP